MERYRITASNANGGLSQRASHLSVPPKPPHVREPPSVPSYRASATARRADDAAELSIFGAERYFNDVPEKQPIAAALHAVADRCDLSTNPRDSSVSSADGYGPRNWLRSGSYYATPTASSEASWNSQSGLLTNLPGSVAVSVRAFPPNEGRKPPPASPNRRLFCRNCPCSGEKSVDVEEKYSEPKSPIRSINHHSDVSHLALKPGLKTEVLETPRVAAMKVTEREPLVEIEEEVTKLKIVAGNWRKEGEVFEASGRFSPEKPSFPTELAHRILNPSKTFNDAGGFSFPVLNPPAINSSADDPARVSLEVFRPSEELGVLRKSAEFQRKTMASFGAIYPTSPKGRGAAAAEDDVASDTSSDLFEIESFSTQYRRRDSLDELTAGLDSRRLAGTANGILRLQRSIEEVGAPSECYAPSEVSVEWSVVTAEGFDRASVANFSSAASEFEELRYAGAEHDRLAAAMAAGAGKRKGNGLLSCRCEKAVSVGPSPVRCVPEQRRVAFMGEHERAHGTGRMGVATAAQDRPALARSYSARMSRAPSTR